MIDSDLEVMKVDFDTSTEYLYKDTAGIYLHHSNLTMTNTTFAGKGKEDSQFVYSIVNDEINGVYGGFLAMHEHSTALLDNVDFNGGRGTLGGCFYMSGNSEASLLNVNFTTCGANYGGGLYAENHRFLELVDVDFF